MRLFFVSLAVLCHIAICAILPGIAAAENGQSPSLQLLRQQQAPGQNVQQPVVPDTLHDIRGPIDLPEPVPYLLYSLIGLAALVLLAILYWWLFKRSKPGPPPIPPGVQARSELMQARELMQPEHALSYMARISEILRCYIEARFGLNTTRRTTREFFQNLAGETPQALGLAGFNTELRMCLECCDMAKFAHQPASLEHLQELEDSILTFVNRTELPATDNPSGGGR